MQLKHVPEETNFQDVEKHGFVTVKDAKGAVLVHMPGMQHNRNIQKLRSGEAVATVKEAVGAAGSEDGSTEAPSEKGSKEAPEAA